MASKQKLSVFVSSTSKDLKNYRAVARLAILDMGWFPEMMEHFGTSPEDTVPACCEKLSGCDLMLLIQAFTRGWVPTPEQQGNGSDSITACELACARKLKIPVLVMMASETWPGNLWEEDQKAREWVKKFRAEINKPAVFFDSEQEGAAGSDSDRFPIFRSKVREILVSHRERLLKEEAELASAESGLDNFESAREGVVGGSTIPFIGTGIYGQGPLGTEALAKALCREAFEGQSCLATASEYRERSLRSRELFLNQLHQVLKDQTTELSEPPLAYSMLLKVKPPPLIVSATCDLLLEQSLEAQGKSYILVCHIVRSLKGQEDGKILVLRNKKPEICLADRVDVRGADYVIYKPLGSPLLHELLDPDLEIDTVVMTETDHLLFLSRLEHESTQVPVAFSRLLQRRPLLFVGYGLDMWQYRLVMQVFQLLGIQGPLTSLAIRKPASSMEELAWRRLGTDLVRLEPGVFAERALASLPDNARVAHAS